MKKVAKGRIKKRLQLANETIRVLESTAELTSVMGGAAIAKSASTSWKTC